MNALKDWKTTVMGIITLILSALVFFGKLSQEQTQTITEWATQIIGIISGIILMFFSTAAKR